MEESKIRIELHDLHAQHSECLNGLSGVTSPVKLRSLITTRAFKAGGIVLVPVTTSILIKKPSETVPTGSVFVRSYKDPKGATFNILLHPSGGIKMPKTEPKTGIGGLKQTPSSFIIPFWLVQDSGSSAPNMKVMTIKTDTHAVSIQVLTNKIDVKKGEVLSAPLAALLPKRKAEDAPAAPAAKKARG